jgi:LacI family transcriptional regulator
VKPSPVILLALPFSFREGVDEYNGVMRFLRERKLPWDLRIVRHSYTADLFREFPVDGLSVLGVDDNPIFCVHTKPSLSSLHPDFEAEGYAAAKAMAALLSGRRIGRLSMVGGTVTCTHRTSTDPCSPAGRLVRKAEEIIAAMALTGLSSDILASELGISRRLLDQRFRQITGHSVRDSIETLRLDNVKRLLKGSVLTHREIAAASGFSSAVYLETVFVKRFGMTMSAYRNS